MQPSPARRLGLTGGQFAVLFLFWIGLAGQAQVQDVILGVAAAGVVTWFTRDLVMWLFPAETPARPVSAVLMQLWHWVVYIPWFAGRIILANLEVAYLVLHPRLPIAPKLLHFTTGLRKTLPRVITANSITLTPGTVTVGLQGDAYLVHTLVDSSAQDILAGRLQDKVGRAFGEAPQGPPQVRWVSTMEELER